jgi:transcriptional regulator with XRE-family HTH domain
MERIRQLRKAKGLSQAKLAVMADMDPATLNRLEQGKGNPNIRTLERVAGEQMELALGGATSFEALELFRAFKQLNKGIEQTSPWFDVDAGDAPGLAQVYDFQEALKRMEKKIGARAS